MRKIFVITILLLINTFTFAQCREYIKAIAPSQLEPYVLDGNFFAPVVYEGDKVTLKRTFLAGQRYKIMILGFDLLQKHITIKDESGLVVFQNYLPKRQKVLNCAFMDFEGNMIPCLGSNYFEFKPDVTTNLEITVTIERKAKRKKDRIRGCLGIVVGYLPKDYNIADTSKKQ